MKDTKKCAFCGREFTRPPSCGRPEWESRRKYCSQACKSEDQIDVRTFVPQKCKAEWCERLTSENSARGLCTRHYQLWLRTGKVYKTQEEKTTEEKFWEKVDKGSGKKECWNWNSGLTKAGYGQFHCDGRNTRAHRYSYELHHGPVPKGKFICHTCDNERCVNPDHLFLGIPKDNSDDMVQKDRQSKGSKRYNAKLTEKDVKVIKRRLLKGEKPRIIAEDFGVDPTTISAINKGRNWKHVEIRGDVA